jgi:hypothetical protein
MRWMTDTAGRDSPPTFRARLLAEAVRALERDGAAPVDDAVAEEAARAAGGGLEERLVRRAAGLRVAGELREALHHLGAITAWTLAAGALVAFVLGASAVRAALGLQQGTLNVYWLLGAVLGAQTIALLVWTAALLAAARRRGPGAPLAVLSLGALVLAAGRRVMSRLQQGAAHRAAVEAAARVHGSGRLGPWTVSAITHSLWLAFNAGALLMTVTLLATRQYTFVWETTILSAREYIWLTQAIAAVPRVLGFAVPDAEQIAASQWMGSPALLGPLAHEARQAWAGLLVGSIVAYGVAPRLLLLGLSLGMRRRARDAFRLDTGVPGHARLADRLLPRTERMEPVLTPTAAWPAGEPPPPAGPPRGTGPPAILGLENTPPREWPPPLPGPGAVGWHDLGIVESRDDRRRVLEALRRGEPPRALVVVCDLTVTPDRGMERFVRELGAQLASPPTVVLSGGQALRRRGHDADGVAARV